jgi:uncharacterized protein (AIM24 family)
MSCIVGFTKDVDYDIEFIGESRTPFFGEGLFYATLRPGTNCVCTIVTIQQTRKIIASAPKAGGDSQ